MLSADGHWLFFLSTAGNLVTNNANLGILQIYTRGLKAGTMEVVSVGTNGTSANGRSDQPSVSADGQLIAFVSEATDLVAGDTNALPDVFVRDRKAATTRLLSHARDGSGANGSSSLPVITPDGRFVFFYSYATNLVGTGSNGVAQLLRADLSTGDLILVDAGSIRDGSQPALARPSDDGMRVLLTSEFPRVPTLTTFTNLLSFLQTGVPTNIVVNSLLSGLGGTPSILPNPDLSADGGTALCAAWFADPGLTNSGLFRVELPGGPAEVITTNLNPTFRINRGNQCNPVLSRDGQMVAFEAASKTTPSGPEAVYIWAATTHAVTLVSSNTVVVAGVTHPQPFGILAGASDDGRFVAWLGYSINGIAYPSTMPPQLFVQDTSSGETRLVTKTATGAASADTTDLPAVSFSADGFQIAFESSAADLVAQDQNESMDVFLYDWSADRLEVVSRAADSLPSITGSGVSFASPGYLSADGQHLVFSSSAPLGTSLSATSILNVYIRNFATGTNQLVSVSADGLTGANGSCRQAAISADGRWVTFSSVASNLVANDTNGVEDVFLRDLKLGQTFLISQVGAQSAPGSMSQNPALTDDGTALTFTSSVFGFGGPSDVYLYERPANALHLIMSGVRGSTRPVFTPDGLLLVFSESSTGLVRAWHRSDGSLHILAVTNGMPAFSPSAFSRDSRKVVFDLKYSRSSHMVLYDLVGNQANYVGASLFSASLNPGYQFGALNDDGSLIACLTNSLLAPPQVALIDLKNGQTNLISQAAGGEAPANGPSFPPLLTPDGRFVIYASQATNLLARDNNGATDLFVTDRESAATLVLSQDASGLHLGNATSGAPTLGRDGRTVLFTSFASNLVDHDFNQGGDLFVVRLPGAESGFRVLSIGRIFSGEVTLIWAAQLTTTFEVQYSDALGSGWTSLNVPILVQNGQGSAVDTSAGGRFSRFYRVLQTAP